MITDAHLHFGELIKKHPESINYIIENEYCGIASCHNKNDVVLAEKFKDKMLISFGIHPQNPDKNLLPLLESLAEEKKIIAVGEIGFDKYSDEFVSNFEKQIEIFEIQLEIALKNKLPVILHIRKAFEEIFKYSKTFRELPAVIFHSYSGTFEQVEFFINRKINVFFSFGTSILNGHKKTIKTLENIPVDRILLETDAPCQPPKGKEMTVASDIEQIYKKVAEIKNIPLSELKIITSDSFFKTLTNNS